jgi:hypothetical protein
MQRKTSFPVVICGAPDQHRATWGKPTPTTCLLCGLLAFLLEAGVWCRNPPEHTAVPPTHAAQDLRHLVCAANSAGRCECNYLD